MKTRTTISICAGDARGSCAVFGGSQPANEGRPVPNLEVRSRAFSLIELLIAITLMTVIVIGLMAMFDQTQRAFRLGMNQTDILESGRIATEMLAREIEQTTPAYQPMGAPPASGPNFYIEFANRSTQPLPGNPAPPQRTNITDDVFFLQRENQTWTGIGYFVRTYQTVLTSAPGGVGDVGTLFRFQTQGSIAQMERGPGGMPGGLARFFSDFDLARRGLNTTNVSRILDGVVNFRVRVFDTNGAAPGAFQAAFPTNSIDWKFAPGTAEVNARFFSNAVPASVELELGILEQQSLERYRSIPVATAQKNFFTGLAGHEHVFRQRISIRNVDPSAYRQ